MFKIRKVQVFKNYLFCLSVFEGSAYWSAHEYHGDKRITPGVAATLVGAAHDKQVQFLIKQAAEQEPAEFKEITVDDQVHISAKMLEDAKNKKP